MYRMAVASSLTKSSFRWSTVAAARQASSSAATFDLLKIKVDVAQWAPTVNHGVGEYDCQSSLRPFQPPARIAVHQTCRGARRQVSMLEDCLSAMPLQRASDGCPTPSKRPCGEGGIHSAVVLGVMCSLPRFGSRRAREKAHRATQWPVALWAA